MKKNLFILLCLSSVLSLADLFSQQPLAGETLTVFAVNGLNLREAPRPNAPVLQVLKTGEKVTVLETFEKQKSFALTVEDIQGHWIKVQYKELTGFAFDGFLSHFPIGNLLAVKRKRVREDDDFCRAQVLGDGLVSYVQAAFPPKCDKVRFSNVKDGEPTYSYGVQPLANGFVLVNVGGHETGGTALYGSNVRLAELQTLLLLMLEVHHVYPPHKKAIQEFIRGKRPVYDFVVFDDGFRLEFNFFKDPDNIVREFFIEVTCTV